MHLMVSSLGYWTLFHGSGLGAHGTRQRFQGSYKFYYCIGVEAIVYPTKSHLVIYPVQNGAIRYLLGGLIFLLFWNFKRIQTEWYPIYWQNNKFSLLANFEFFGFFTFLEHFIESILTNLESHKILRFSIPVLHTNFHEKNIFGKNFETFTEKSQTFPLYQFWITYIYVLVNI